MKSWTPPSFDAPPSTVGDPQVAPTSQPLQQLLTPQELQTFGQYPHQEGFLRGLQQGLQEGRAQGQAIGREEGWKAGHQQGYQVGLSQGLQEGLSDLQRLSEQLTKLVESLRMLPEMWSRELGELVFLTASRIAATSKPDRLLVSQAVQDILGRLPQPGENLVLRVCPREFAAWSAVTGDDQHSIKACLVADPEFTPGQAWLELGSTRVDISDPARTALLKNALSLLSDR